MLVVFLTTSIFVFAQKRDIGQREKIEVGGTVGVANYTGDLAKNYNFKFHRPAMGAFLRYNVSPSFVLRANLMYASLFANDDAIQEPLPQARSMEFQSNIVESAFIMEYNFFDFRSTNKKRNWTPYLFGGLGYYATINATFPNPDQEQLPNGVSLPFGMGIKFCSRDHTKGWNFGAEFGARKTFTDAIDGINDEFVNAQGAPVGDPKNKDFYYYFGGFVSYTFIKVICPKR